LFMQFIENIILKLFRCIIIIAQPGHENRHGVLSSIFRIIIGIIIVRGDGGSSVGRGSSSGSSIGR
jgi:hypothetical protein